MTSDAELLRRARALFEAAPWLRDHDRVVHLPVAKQDADPKAKDYDKRNMPPILWHEFYRIIELATPAVGNQP
jgi:hypothetical protein